jgi:hypothetical protein
MDTLTTLLAKAEELNLPDIEQRRLKEIRLQRMHEINLLWKNYVVNRSDELKRFTVPFPKAKIRVPDKDNETLFLDKDDSFTPIVAHLRLAIIGDNINFISNTRVSKDKWEDTLLDTIYMSSTDEDLYKVFDKILVKFIKLFFNL